MLSLRTPTGRVAWPLLSLVLAAQFAVLCLAWELSRSGLPQGVLLVVCFFPLRALSVRAADTDPFLSRPASQTRQLDLILVGGFIVLLFGLGAALDDALKSLDIYPGPYAVAYLAGWVPLAIAWNVRGYQRAPSNG